jgi:hypothetical protein
VGRLRAALMEVQDQVRHHPPAVGPIGASDSRSGLARFQSLGPLRGRLPRPPGPEHENSFTVMGL